MRTLVLYESNTGTTKGYAEAIAEAVHGDVMPLKKYKWKKFADNYDAVVFGGWVMGGEIRGLNKFLTNWDIMEGKTVIVFAVGMGVATKETRANLIQRNVLDMYHLRFYQFRGSFDFQKLKFPYSYLMKHGINQLMKDPTAAASGVAEADLEHRPIYFDDTEKVAKVVSVLRTVSAEMEAREKLKEE